MSDKPSCIQSSSSMPIVIYPFLKIFNQNNCQFSAKISAKLAKNIRNYAYQSSTCRSLGKFWTQKSQEQQQLQEYNNKQMMEITSDIDYGTVKDVFNEHVTNPQVTFALQSGQTTYDKEYNKVVRTYYRTVAKKSRDTGSPPQISGMRGWP